MNIDNPFHNYHITFTGQSKKFLKTIDKPTGIRIIEKIEMLVQDIQSLDVKKLAGFKNLYRVRMGDYRIVYRPDQLKKEILVCIIGHRSQIYQSLKNISAH